MGNDSKQKWIVVAKKKQQPQKNTYVGCRCQFCVAIGTAWDICIIFGYPINEKKWRMDEAQVLVRSVPHATSISERPKYTWVILCCVVSHKYSFAWKTTEIVCIEKRASWFLRSRITLFFRFWSAYMVVDSNFSTEISTHCVLWWLVALLHIQFLVKPESF